MFIEATDERFFDAWQRLYDSCGFISPFYSKKALEYYRQRPLDENCDIMDYSFVYIKEDEPCGALILSKIQRENRVDILSYEVPGTALIKENALSKKDISQINGRIDPILEELNGEFHFRDYLECGYISIITRRFLMQGVIPSAHFSSIIDLDNSLEYLHKRVRKSYKSLVNWGAKFLSIELFDYSNITLSIMEKFQNLHFSVAGKKTRSDDSWRIQYEMIQNNEAFLLLGKSDQQVITGSFYMFSSNVCYYGVSASIREMFDKPLSHSLVWKAIEYAKLHGCRYFEMGEQKYIGSFNEAEVDEKQLSISDFKAGFGGDVRVSVDLRLDNYSSA